MTTIFVDTAAWLALINSRDKYHVPAQGVMDKLRQQGATLLTTGFVLLEVADALAAPEFRPQTIRFLDSLSGLSVLTVVSVSQELMDNSWHLYSHRLDKSWGLTDCTSFVVMTQREITTAFTSDHHFVQAGFQKLM